MGDHLRRLETPQVDKWPSEVGPDPDGSHAGRGALGKPPGGSHHERYDIAVTSRDPARFVIGRGEFAELPLSFS